MALVRRLLTQMDMHHAGAGLERRFRLARHLLRRDRNVVLFRIGQHAVQRAGDDSLVAHASSLDRLRSRAAESSPRIMRPASCGFLRPPAIKAVTVVHGLPCRKPALSRWAGSLREIARSRE